MREALFRLSYRAFVGRPRRLRPSNTRFKVSCVTNYTTGPIMAPREGFEPSQFGLEIRCHIQFGHRGRLAPPGRFKLPISWFEARGLIQFGYGGMKIVVASSGIEPLTSRLSAVCSTSLSYEAWEWAGRIELPESWVAARRFTPFSHAHSKWRPRPVLNWLPLA